MKKVHLIGNAHIDPVWLWQWQEGFAEIKATFKSALDRMNEFPDFKFTSACSAYYMWIEKSDKKMFDEIVRRVHEGRWCIVGGWFIQPDCNLPCGESFARHALISQRYFKEKFGVTATVGYNADSFGHNGNLPQILKLSGMENYVFMRPMPHEKELPSDLFKWESMDGSRVLAYRIPEFYNIDSTRLDVFERIAESAETVNKMAFYGVGNHGGGPTVELLDKMHKVLDNRFVYSTPNEYFKEVKNASVPVVRDDLQYHATGCYSAVSKIKADNRLCENKLFQAEAFSVLSEKLMGTDYPRSELKKAWENVLFNQFHDTLGGCAIKEVYTDAAYLHGEALAIADRNINFALQQISWNIDTMDGKELKPYKQWPPAVSWRAEENIGTPVVVFNPLPYAVSEVVSVRDNALKMTDDSGREIPIQKVRDSKTNCGDKYKTAFRAEIPALGYTVYRMYFEKSAENAYVSDLCASDTHMENEYLCIRFDPESGNICSILDKKTNKVVLKNSETILLDETDSDTWSHGINTHPFYAACKNGSCRLIENGPVRAAVRCVQQFENTEIIRDFYLAARDSKVTVRTKIDFREKHKMLKFSFDSGLNNAEIYCEIPFGYIKRPANNAEQPCGAWIAAANGFGIATDSKYGFSASEGKIDLTVLRGAIYADHYGERDEFCEFMDQGEHEFTYVLFPFRSFADCERQAEMLNNKPTAIVETFHHGSLKTTFSGISVSESNIMVTALKKHEDSNSYVLRCYEAENKDTNVRIHLFGTEFSAFFSHNEIKTFVLSENGVAETNFMEEL